VFGTRLLLFSALTSFAHVTGTFSALATPSDYCYI